MFLADSRDILCSRHGQDQGADGGPGNVQLGHTSLLQAGLRYSNYYKLKGAARYAGLFLAPAEGFGLRPRPFFVALWAKKVLLYIYVGPFSHFW